MQNSHESQAGATRRDFIKTSAVVGAAAASGFVIPAVHAAENNTIKIGLVGCGGRGKGAAKNALMADPNVKLVALGEAFEDKVQEGLKILKADADVGNKVDVPKENLFVGFDAYKGVIEKSDVVLLATPPHFRPLHLRAVIEAGKHCFCEKPVGVDVPSVKRVLEAAKMAADKKLSLVSGLCYRYDDAVKEGVAKVHDGVAGDIISLQGNYLTTWLWSVDKKPEMTDMEWQVRNWLYFTWLSGDHIVEQHIHTLDKMMWIMHDEPPIKCTANGGRANRVEYPKYGNIYDHFDTVYEWANGVRAQCHTRQWLNADTDTSDWIFGTKGTAELMSRRIFKGDKTLWKRRPSATNMYDAEHVALFKSIRKGEPINNGDYMAKSTLAAIMGRTAAYTGKTVYWDKNAAKTGGPSVKKDTPILMESTEDFTPPAYDWNAKISIPPIVVPGRPDVRPDVKVATA